MLHRRSSGPEPWALAAGAAAGAGALAFAVARGVRLLRRRRHAHEAVQLPAELTALEESAVEALRRDRETGVCAIDVAAVAPGIVELTGVVPTHDVAQRATRLLHAVSGVNTVISRLEVGSFEERLASARSRNAEGDPQLRDRRWYGVRVGTGQRRQSPETEPDRPDDSVPRRTRELEIQPSDLADAAQSSAESGGAEHTDRPM
ncbi:MAG TPA: BON domain-containing protein [Longimicrobiales bacterium]|nr:BON domain-containing protein [Longimicrobiales bacterium]